MNSRKVPKETNQEIICIYFITHKHTEKLLLLNWHILHYTCIKQRFCQFPKDNNKIGLVIAVLT